MADKSFEIGELVWAKMKGYAPWPAKIATPPEDSKSPTKLKKHQYYVFFFGSKNFGWIAKEDITKHSAEMVKAANMKKRTAQMQSAIDEIVQLSKRCSGKKSQNVKPHNGIAALKQVIQKRKRASSPEDASIKKKQRLMPKNTSPDLAKKMMGRSPPKKQSKDIGKVNSEKQIKVRSTSEQAEVFSTEKQTKDPADKSSTKKRRFEKPTKEIAIKKHRVRETGLDSSSERPAKRRHLFVCPHCPNVAKRLKKKKSTKVRTERPRKVSEVKPATHDAYTRFLANYDTVSLTSARLAPLVETFLPPIVKKPLVFAERQPLPDLDPEALRDIVNSTKVVHPDLKIGFIGLGTIGRGIVKTLIAAGFDVRIWNRTDERCRPFVTAGIQRTRTPAELVMASDVIFSCLKDGDVVKRVVFGKEGVIRGFDRSGGGKSYVEMTLVDKETSESLAEAIQVRGGRYLEANFYGTTEMAEKGELLLSIAGDETLYTELEPCLDAMSQMKRYIGADPGSSSLIINALNMLEATTSTTFAEVMKAAKEYNVNQMEFFKITQLTPWYCDLLKDTGEAILTGDFRPKVSVSRILNSLRLTLKQCKQNHFSNFVLAATQGLYARAEAMDYGDQDMSAVYMVYDQHNPPLNYNNNLEEEEEEASSPEPVTVEDD